MTTNDNKVDAMKKISLLFRSGTAPDKMDLTSAPVKYEFILGLGTEGLTPFEYELVNKSIDDELVLAIKREEISSRFKHMASFILRNISIADIFYLSIKIIDISVPENREIIKAMAENAACGHDDCDCGCGGI